LRLASDGQALWLVTADDTRLRILAAHCDEDGLHLDATALARRYAHRCLPVDA
jgi:hypothetical protein